MRVEQLVFAFDLDKLLPARQQLAYAFLPLSTVSHLIILVDLLYDDLSIEPLRMHLQNLQGFLE